MKLTTATLLALREGRITYANFVRATRSDFDRLAWKVLTEHPKDDMAPIWMNWEDITQDMLMSVPTLVQEWRPDSGMSLKSFVVYRVCATGVRMLARARTHRAVERANAPREEATTPEAIQERVAMVQQLLELLPETPLQHHVLESMIRTQSIAKTTRELARDPRTMRTFAVADDIASKKIRRVLVLLADRAQSLR